MESTDLIMYFATGANVISVLPELYANYINKNANVYNLPEKIMLVIGSSLGFSYGIMINNTPVCVNYGIFILLDSISLFMRVYYASYNKFNSSSNYHRSLKTELEPEINTPA
jgi:uncharacterized protein with PQ loop repeat